MASPKTDHLPIVIPAGIIWDGVTEYQRRHSRLRPSAPQGIYLAPHVRG